MLERKGPSDSRERCVLGEFRTCACACEISAWGSQNLCLRPVRSGRQCLLGSAADSMLWLGFLHLPCCSRLAAAEDVITRALPSSVGIHVCHHGRCILLAELWCSGRCVVSRGKATWETRNTELYLRDNGSGSTSCFHWGC